MCHHLPGFIDCFLLLVMCIFLVKCILLPSLSRAGSGSVPGFSRGSKELNSGAHACLAKQFSNTFTILRHGLVGWLGFGFYFLRQGFF